VRSRSHGGPRGFTAHAPVGLVVSRSLAPGTPSHLGGMREFRANKVGRSFFDGLWFDEFGDDIRDPKPCSMSRWKSKPGDHRRAHLFHS
jgi:hypothetical protein